MAPKKAAGRSAKSSSASSPSTMAEQCLALRARALNRAVSAIYDRALQPHDLKVSQFNLLVAIAGHPGVLASRIGVALCLDESTLSRNLERMRERGWISIDTSEDSRARPLRLTASGSALLDRATPAWDEAQRQALEALGDANAAALLRVAGRFLST